MKYTLVAIDTSNGNIVAKSDDTGNFHGFSNVRGPIGKKDNLGKQIIDTIPSPLEADTVQSPLDKPLEVALGLVNDIGVLVAIVDGSRQGPAGPQGPTGPQGPAGIDGKVGL